MNRDFIKPLEGLPLGTFTRNGIDWVADEAYAPMIAGELLSVLRAPGNAPIHRVLRENSVRRTMLLQVPGQAQRVFAKLYKPPRGVAERCKYFLLPSKAVSEWKNILSLYRKGLPVARPLARGERRLFRFLQESCFFTTALEDARGLNAIEQSHFTLSQKRGMIDKTAVLVAALHNRGFFFRDLHAGNIVLVPDGGDDFSLFLVDFHKVWHTRWVARWMRIRDLAQLNNSVALSRQDRWRFIKMYAQQSRMHDSGLVPFAQRIEHTAKNMWAVHLRSRTRRCLKDSTEFAIHRTRRLTIYRQKRYHLELIERLAAQYLEQTLPLKPVTLKRTDKESVSVITLHDAALPGRMVIKEWSFPSLLSRVRYRFFKTRARRSWIAARALRVRGIATPEALALVEYRSPAGMDKSLLFLEYLDQSQELNDYVLRHYQGMLAPEKAREKERFIATLSLQLRNMHERGVYHADLKSNNILVCENSTGWMFYFIDLDRIRVKQQLSFKERVNNLAQINASIADCITPADRLLFFKLYAQGTPLIRQGKKYFQSIMSIGRRKNTGPYGITFPQIPNLPSR